VYYNPRVLLVVNQYSDIPFNMSFPISRDIVGENTIYFFQQSHSRLPATTPSPAQIDLHQLLLPLATNDPAWVPRGPSLLVVKGRKVIQVCAKSNWSANPWSLKPRFQSVMIFPIKVVMIFPQINLRKEIKIPMVCYYPGIHAHILYLILIASVNLWHRSTLPWCFSLVNV
jgi:hypothetical protein